MKRGRNQRRRQGANPNRALDSNGPEVRIRGTANQIYDKYVALARDASSSGDRVKAESYLQHAEHYFRLIRSVQQNQPSPNHQQPSAAPTEQPSVNDGEASKEEGLEERERANGADQQVNSAPVEDGEKASASEGDEERKPRRRRTRRPTKRADDAAAEKETPAKEKSDSEAAAAE